MDSEISLIRSLATTLLSEIDSIAVAGRNHEETETIILSDVVREFEIKLIKTALIRTGGNQRRAACLLGIKVTTLHNKIKNYGLNLIHMAT